MRKFWLLLGFTLLAGNLLLAKGVFQKGNDAYQKGQFEQAILFYESILKDKKHSCDLYFNLANSYYKTGKIGPAIFYYEKALLLSPNDKDIQNNLKIANQKTIDELPGFTSVGIEKAIAEFTSKFHHNTWGYFAIIWSFLFVLGFFLYQWSANSWLKRIFFGSILVSGFGILSCIGIGQWEKNRIQSETFAIVFSSTLEVKNEPNGSANKAFELHEGSKIKLLESMDGWHKIAASEDMIGWVPKGSVKAIK